MERATRGQRGIRAAAQVPVDLERALLLAAQDPEFRERLLADPAAAIAGAGIALTASEAALLAAMPRPALAAMIDRLAPARQRNRVFARAVGAAAVVGGLLVVSCDGGNDTAQAGGADPGTDVDSDSDSDSDADAGADAGE